jgi:uncharacterized membrane protein YeaQ/YmgE (transglycosylase-associated protein family)
LQKVPREHYSGPRVGLPIEGAQLPIKKPKPIQAATAWVRLASGAIAKFFMPGDNDPSGFILTAILGIVGAFVATYLDQALGWYGCLIYSAGGASRTRLD